MTDPALQKGTATPPATVLDEFPIEAKKLEAKDLVVFVSLLGSVLAIIYDTGFFWGLDLAFFTFFSIAEHLLFALEAIPITLLIVFVLLMLLGEIAWSELHHEQFIKSGGVMDAPMPAWKRRVGLAVVAASSLYVAQKLLREEQTY